MRAGVGLVGSLCLFSGVFLPVSSLPFAQHISYFQHGHGDGVWVAGCAIAAFFLVNLRRYILLWVPILISSLTMGYSLHQIWLKREQLRALAESSAYSQEVLQLTPMLAEAVHLRWGAVVLLIGLMLLMTAASWPFNDPDSYSASAEAQ